MHFLFIIAFFLLPNEVTCTTIPSQETVVQSSEIPQGKMEYELYYSEWDGRMPNTSIDVIIKGNHITVLKNEKTNLTGDQLIIEGTLMKHVSGVWIITDQPSDKDAEEIGGCTGGPIPINFKTKVLEWC